MFFLKIVHDLSGDSSTSTLMHLKWYNLQCTKLFEKVNTVTNCKNNIDYNKNKPMTLNPVE